MTAWVTAIGALAAIAAIVLRMWWENRPARKAKEARDEAGEIDDAVTGGDADAVNDLLHDWQREDD